MKRLYFLVPTVASAEAIVTELKTEGVTEDDIHVLAKQAEALEHLPEASLAQHSDIWAALQRGVAVGGTTGLLAGLAALAFPPAGIVIGGGAVFLSTALGASIGAWAASLIGVSVPNTHLQEYEAAIEQGQILMLVDVPDSRVDPIREIIIGHHPEAEIRQVESTYSNAT